MGWAIYRKGQGKVTRSVSAICLGLLLFIGCYQLYGFLVGYTWGQEALYANPFDPESFGHAVATILMQPRVAAQLARFGSQKARARFTWTGVAQQVLNVLQGAESVCTNRTLAAAGYDADRSEREPEPEEEEALWLTGAYV